MDKVLFQPHGTRRTLNTYNKMLLLVKEIFALTYHMLYETWKENPGDRDRGGATGVNVTARKWTHNHGVET